MRRQKKRHGHNNEFWALPLNQRGTNHVGPMQIQWRRPKLKIVAVSFFWRLLSLEFFLWTVSERPETMGCHMFSENYDQQLSDLYSQSVCSRCIFCKCIFVFLAYTSSKLCEFIITHNWRIDIQTLSGHVNVRKMLSSLLIGHWIQKLWSILLLMKIVQREQPNLLTNDWKGIFCLPWIGLPW